MRIHPTSCTDEGHPSWSLVIRWSDLLAPDCIVRFKNPKNRGVLEPGGLNVERVRVLLRGDQCQIPRDL